MKIIKGKKSFKLILNIIAMLGFIGVAKNLNNKDYFSQSFVKAMECEEEQEANSNTKEGKLTKIHPEEKAKRLKEVEEKGVRIGMLGLNSGQEFEFHISDSCKDGVDVLGKCVVSLKKEFGVFCFIYHIALASLANAISNFFCTDHELTKNKSLLGSIDIIYENITSCYEYIDGVDYKFDFNSNNRSCYTDSEIREVLSSCFKNICDSSKVEVAGNLFDLFKKKSLAKDCEKKTCSAIDVLKYYSQDILSSNEYENKSIKPNLQNKISIKEAVERLQSLVNSCMKFMATVCGIIEYVEGCEKPEFFKGLC